MNKRITISQIAEHSGYSIATVSRYLNGSSRIRPATARTIADSINKLKASSPEATSSVGGGSLILINIPTLANPFFDEIIRGIQDTAQKKGYSTLLNVQNLVEANEQAFFKMLSQVHIAGAIVLNPIERSFFDKLFNTIPFVQCCEIIEDQKQVSYVTIDDISAAKKMMDYLMSIKNEKIALLMGPSEYKCSKLRKIGYEEALTEAGYHVNHDWIVQVPNYDFNTSYSAIHRLLELEDRPEAIFAMSDTMAAAAIRACNAAGFRVPQDIIVAGFDNIPYSQMNSPSITTVSQPRYNLGCTACDLLADKINNPNSKPQQLMLDTELIIRESTQLYGAKS